MAGRAGLRAGSAGFAKRRNRPARRHRGRFSADESVAGAAGIFRRRTGIAPRISIRSRKFRARKFPTSRCRPPAKWEFLKQRQNRSGQNRTNQLALATLLDYLPRETIFLLCEPESLAVHADAYAQQVPADDPFFISWPDFLVELSRRGFTSVELSDAEDGVRASAGSPDRLKPNSSGPSRSSALRVLLRSTRSVHWPSARRNRRSPRRSGANFSSSFTAGCGRITPSTFSATTTASGSASRKSGRKLVGQASRLSPSEKSENRNWTTGATPVLHCTSARWPAGFICDEAKLVVVTDAEIFGRYKIQRPRRQKSLARAGRAFRARH